MGKEGCPPDTPTPTPAPNLESYSDDSDASDKDVGLDTCRVCQCAESDNRGDAALEFLNIVPPPLRPPPCKIRGEISAAESETNVSINNTVREARFVELVSPDGEVLICNVDLEMGSSDHQQDTLVELGCACKNDLALVHYACALKWFVNHGSTVCEICGHPAENISTADVRKVVAALKEYEALRERTASGEPNPAHVFTNTDVDPDAIAAIRRQRLSEISLWFGPHNNTTNNNRVPVSQVASEHSLNTALEDVTRAENPATKWAVEGTGILLATGLLTVTLAWLLAPRVGKVCRF